MRGANGELIALQPILVKPSCQNGSHKRDPVVRLVLQPLSALIRWGSPREPPPAVSAIQRVRLIRRRRINSSVDRPPWIDFAFLAFSAPRGISREFKVTGMPEMSMSSSEGAGAEYERARNRYV